MSFCRRVLEKLGVVLPRGCDSGRRTSVSPIFTRNRNLAENGRLEGIRFGHLEELGILSQMSPELCVSLPCIVF